MCSQASQLIVNFDEHEVNTTFKFGVVYQQFGQVSGTLVPHGLPKIYPVTPVPMLTEVIGDSGPNMLFK